MKKVAILTINDNYNYGNRLQNYAVQEVLKKHNLEPDTIYNKKGIHGKYFIKNIKDTIKKYVKRDKLNLRHNKFLEFNKNIKFSKYAIDYEHIPNTLGNKYDCFFAGSDQIWNYSFNRMSDVDFLTFAPSKKRNAISASFGVDKIPEELQEYYKRNLEQFNNISVREEAGKKIIEDLTGRTDIEVLIDPTMMISKEEWTKLARKPSEIKENEKYILNYFLGEVSEDKKMEIERVANENNCKVIDMLNDVYILGPREFIYLIENAFLVCTDSFHACAFSILYNKPFIILKREDELVNMYSRINTLLSKFEIKDRKFKEEISDEQLKCDYSKAYAILEKEREKFNQYIQKIIK